MEFIFEIIYEVLIEGIGALIRNRQIPRPWRIFCLTLLIAPPFALFYAITYHSYPLTFGDYFTGLLMLLLAAAWFLGVSWIIRTGPEPKPSEVISDEMDQLPDPGSDRD